MQPERSLPGTLAFGIFLVFLFLTLSRFQEFLTLTVGFRSRLYTIALVLMIPTAILTGRWILACRSVPGILLLAFTGWMAVGLPFAIWKGGTFKVLTDEWPPSLFTFLVVGGMIASARDLRRTLYVAAFSMIVVIAMYPHFERVDSGGRVAVLAGSLGNSNDVAMHLLMGLPFLMFVFGDQQRITFTRIAALAASLGLFLILVRTGSRAGLLGLGVLMIATFLFASMAGKFKLIAVSSIVLLLMFGSAPQSVVERYRTLFNDDVTNEATASKEGRIRLLKESIRQTFLHPVFGVGAGNFPVANANVRAAQGIFYHRYRESHNTYTEISSETGFPGFFLWFGAMVWCFRTLYRVYRRTAGVPQHKQLSGMALAVFLSLLTFSVTTFFGSNAYRYYFPVFAGLAVSLKRVAEQEGVTLGPGMRPVPMR
jgi:O-antigen ligase